ncbi:MAG: hypothetical protein ABGY71_08205 [bacterium]|jgi:hypothetical protein|nr:hypothetical protein [Planctomycetota bacterium]HIL51730.1 hypothetical protein [Planctomycetota bacterium]
MQNSIQSCSLFARAVLCLALCAGSLCAQKTLPKIPATDFTRATVVDDDGFQQFKEYSVKCEPCRGRGAWDCRGCEKVEMPGCLECDGKKKAPCRDCAGSGQLLDPLVALPCPYCAGSAWYRCAQCNGFAELSETRDENVTMVACGACKKRGRYECVVCDGKRKLPSIPIKRKPVLKAKLKDLLKTREKLIELLPRLEAFEPLGRAAKTSKALTALLKKPCKLLPPLKNMQELLETVQKGLVKAGSGYKNFEESQDHQFRLFRDRSIYLVRHSVRVLDLCIARAEFNAAVKK